MHGHFGSRSGQQASLLPIFVTRPPTPMADAETAKPPEAIPDRYKDAVGKLDPRAQALYITHRWPWSMQAAMATDEMYSVNDLAYRWDTTAQAREHGLRDLGLGQVDPPWTDKAKALVKVRIAQAVDEARALLNTPSQLGPLRVTSGKAMEGKLSALCDRHQLMGSYAQVFGGPEPHLYEQGSDAFLKAQFVHVSKGQIGWFDPKYIISALPELGEKPMKTNRKTVIDGWTAEEEEEIRKLPEDRRQLERMIRVFCTTLLMCLSAFPQHSKLQITKGDLDDWYQWFWGPEIAAAHPRPGDRTLLFAERNAWKEIHNMVFSGTPLKEAMEKQKNNLLFWNREVCQRAWALKGGKGHGYEKPVIKSWTKQGQKGKKGDRPTKGKPKGKTPTKGKEGKGGTWPQHWATKDFRGKPYCRDYHLKKSCPGQCGRSHNCPVQAGTWICNAAPTAHSPEECPNRPQA